MNLDWLCQSRNRVLKVLLVLYVRFVFVCSDELIFVHALWRHGDRTPVHLIPSDKINNESSWHQGLGELTEKGIRRQYELGKLLRRRYVDSLKFLHLCDATKEIFVRSTDYNRTLMSAFSLLAGLLNSSCYQNESLDQSLNHVKGWYPFPVHAVPRPDDSLLGDDVVCPKADWLYNETIQRSPKYKEVEKEYKKFFRFLSRVTAETVVFENVSKVFDPLRVIKLHQNKTFHPLPAWANETVLETVTVLYEKLRSFMVVNDEYVKLMRGQLLGEIVGRLNEIVNRTTSNLDDEFHRNKLRFYAYSAHDNTLLSFLGTVGVYKFRKFFVPDYSSCILIELWKTFENEYVVKLLMRKNDAEEFKETQIYGCPDLPEPCLLSTFTKAARRFIPRDWKVECRLDSWLIIHFTHLVIGLSALITFLLLAVVLTFTAIIRLLSISRRRYDGYRRVGLDNIPEKLVSGTILDDVMSEDDEIFDKL